MENIDTAGLVLEFEVDREADFVYDKENTRDPKTGKLWTAHKDAEYKMRIASSLVCSFEIVIPPKSSEGEPLRGLQIGKSATDLGIWTGQRTLEALERQQHVIPEQLNGSCS